MSVRQPPDSTILCALLEPFACPALIVDVNRRIRAVNAEFRTRFPFRPEAVGAHCHEILHDSPRRCPKWAFLCPLDACARTGAVVPAIHPHAGPDGPQEEQVLLRPILTDDGAVVACLATLRRTGPASGRYEGEGARGAFALAPVCARIEGLARSRRPLLIVGEPGAGKASVARAIHRQGPTWGGGWEERNGFELTPVAVRGLWETARKIGRGGTLYVRGAHKLPLRTQDTLVEVLAATARSRRGWRLIAGTDRDLRALARTGFFRRPLLDCFGRRKLNLPPLRERKDELPEIAAALLREMGGSARGLTDEALQRLRLHPFLGNVEELARALRHASVVARGAQVGVEHLPCWLGSAGEGAGH